MRELRGVAVAIGIGAILAAILRLKGSTPAPSGTGGWTELTAADLADAGPADSAPGAGGPIQ